MTDTVAITAGSGTTIATDDIGGVHYQRVKLAVGADGTAVDFANAATTGTLSNVSASASNVTVLASNANRLGASIFNDSTSIAYFKFGATASATSFTIKVAAGSYFELPATKNGGVYTGIIDGIWVAANGSARVTEVTA